MTEVNGVDAATCKYMNRQGVICGNRFNKLGLCPNYFHRTTPGYAPCTTCKKPKLIKKAGTLCVLCQGVELLEEEKKPKPTKQEPKKELKKVPKEPKKAE